MNKSNRILYILTGFTVIFLAIAVFGVGVYKYQWNNQTVNSVLKVLPYPAAVVNNSFITMADVNSQVNTFKKAVKYQGDYDFDSDEGQQFLNTQKDQIISALIDQELVKDLAGIYDIRLTDEGVDEYAEYLLADFNIDKSEADSQLGNIFGWDFDEFKQNLAKPDLLRARLRMRIFENSTDSQAYNKIKQAQQALEGGASFEETAAEYSEDQQSRFIAGEIGLFTENTLAPWFSSVSELEQGEISDVIVSPDGYHIFQVSFRDETQDLPQFQLRHIFVGSDRFEQIFEEFKKQSTIYRVK